MQLTGYDQQTLEDTICPSLMQYQASYLAWCKANGKSNCSKLDPAKMEEWFYHTKEFENDSPEFNGLKLIQNVV